MAAPPRLIPGGAYKWTYRDSALDATATRLLIVLDSPDLAGGMRVVGVYDPAGGSSEGMATSGTSIEWTMSPTLTATMAGNPGVWSVYVLVGAESVQSPVLPSVSKLLTVERPPMGSIPTS